MGDRVSRRTFLGTAASTAIGAGVAARRASAARARSKPGPNETINVGLIGCGSRGPYIAYVFQITPGVRVTALCDVHRGHLATAREQAEKVGGHKVSTYHDYRKLLDDKDLDAVIVATNIHWHVLPAIDACAAGKDVYLEKPVGTSIGEGRAAVAAARKHHRIVQMGTQQHSWEHYVKAVEIIQSGELGEISQVGVWDIGNFYPGLGSPPDGPAPEELDWDFWVGPSPEVPYNLNRFKYHDWFFGSGGGWQLAWGVHHYDIVHWALGVNAPAAATGMGGKFAFADEDDNRQWPDTFNGACEYPPGPVARKGFLLSYTCRTGCDQPIMGCRHGKAFYGTDGVLVIDRYGFTIHSQRRRDKKVIVEKKVTSTRKEHEVVQDHVKLFIESVRLRQRPAADIEVGHCASNPGHLMNIAWRVGRRVKWDPQGEQVIDDPQAQAWVTKDYRRPWVLPA